MLADRLHLYVVNIIHSGMHGSPVCHQDHAQPVLSLLLGADALGLRREEDRPGRPHFPHKVCDGALGCCC